MTELENTNEKSFEVVVIGAGPAGLACGGRLKKAGISFIILEKESEFSPSWRNHYDRLHLHTVAKFSHLPFRPFPKGFPQYVPKDQLIAYYDSYVSELDLPIQVNTEIVSVKKKEGARWRIETRKGKFLEADHVIIATGFNRKPNIPDWTGLDVFRGEVYHSSKYKNALKYRDKVVLVVGMGNSGAEIALDLAENGSKTYLSVRSPVNIVPRDFLGNPTQLTAKKLSLLPHWLSDWIGNQVQKISIGNLEKYGITTPKTAPARQLREEAKTPVLDIGTVKAIKRGIIHVVPGIDYLDEQNIYFIDGRSIKPDCIIMATGYKPAIEEFVENGRKVLNGQGNPQTVNATDEFDGLHFVGFDAYSNGILESIYRDSETAVKSILEKRRPSIIDGPIKVLPTNPKQFQSFWVLF